MLVEALLLTSLSAPREHPDGRQIGSDSMHALER